MKTPARFAASVVDALDRRILQILVVDAHTPMRDIAARTGTTVGTVHNRIKRMRQDGVIRRFEANVDAAKLGFPTTAMVELAVDGGHAQDVAALVADDPAVSAAYDVTGDIDVVVIAKCADLEALHAFIKRVAGLQHVTTTRTRIVLQTLKEGVVPRLG